MKARTVPLFIWSACVVWMAGSVSVAHALDRHCSGGTANCKMSTSGTGSTNTMPVVERGLRRAKPFIVYEHIHNRGRPGDLTPYGLVPIELCYNTKTKEKVQASVRAKYALTGGPVVFDIEKTSRGDHEVTTGHLKEVVEWAHQAVPECKVGHYAVGPSNLTPLDKPIEKVVDAFFPSMYFHNTNRRAWKQTATKLVQRGHRYHKPVYLFLMPKFHGKEGGTVPRSFWAFQLAAAFHAGADGVVIWSSDHDRWDDNAGWWLATKNFMKNLEAGRVDAPNEDVPDDDTDAASEPEDSPQ